MSGLLRVAVSREGRVARLSNVTCTLGRGDKPYPEAHARDVWTIALVRRGTFGYRPATTKRPQALRSGWILFGHPNAEYECSHEQDGGDECTSLAVSEEVIWDVTRTAKISTQSIRAAPRVLPPAARVAALLEQARRRNGADVDELGYLVAESVVAQASGARLDVGAQWSDVRRVQDGIAHIEAACTEPLSLSGLARAVGLSPYYFLRLFRRVTGTTPHQYLLSARLRLAAQMLLDTQRSVSQIAYEVGFQDLSNFVRTFHRVIGRSPGAYRRA